MILYRYITGPDDAAFCHRITAMLNKGWFLYGAPTLTYDAEQKRVVCGQAITKDVADREYDPGMDLSSF
ncbi:DUF1737 domain-containing protein [Dongia sedimenti]|uniref:DUF1737 domain-containing protein n=1 Tax=Dongia sedimenti TaxID=3064282 RepID=A0ABU0YF32_9PROT|nr:DUF1737 domain-containing protein [Rhodospirillaceae bacterium R-7]